MPDKSGRIALEALRKAAKERADDAFKEWAKASAILGKESAEGESRENALGIMWSAREAYNSAMAAADAYENARVWESVYDNAKSEYEKRKSNWRKK